MTLDPEKERRRLHEIAADCGLAPGAVGALTGLLLRECKDAYEAGRQYGEARPTAEALKGYFTGLEAELATMREQLRVLREALEAVVHDCSESMASDVEYQAMLALGSVPKPVQPKTPQPAQPSITVWNGSAEQFWRSCKQADSFGAAAHRASVLAEVLELAQRARKAGL